MKNRKCLYILLGLIALLSLVFASPTIAEDKSIGVPLNFDLEKVSQEKHLKRLEEMNDLKILMEEDAGRYHIFVGDHKVAGRAIWPKATILLDTKTGKIWTLDYLWRIKDGEPFETDILQFVKKTTEGIYETDYYHRAKQEFQEYYKKKETK